MKEKRRVHRFAHGVVSAKRKGNIAYAATHVRSGKILLYPTRCLDEVDRVIAMLVEPGRDGKNVGVKDNITGREIRLLGQEIVSPRADVDLSVERVCLAVLIKSHYDNRRAISLNQSRVREKFLLTVFQADGIHDRFALHAFQARLDHAPFRAVDHERNARDLRLTANQIQKPRHGCFGIDHSFVHIYVEDVRSAPNLLTRNRERTFEIARQNQLRKLRRASDVGTLTNDNKTHFWRDIERLKPGKL